MGGEAFMSEGMELEEMTAKKTDSPAPDAPWADEVATGPEAGFKLPSPEEVRAEFSRLLAEGDAEGAVRYLFDLEVKCDYIKVAAIAKNLHWEAETDFGPLEISINLAKPEKDPRAIAAALAKKKEEPAAQSELDPSIPVPQCDLCFENEEFPGTPDHPAKPGLRVMRITLAGEEWGFQYSPYAYFEEHCITQSAEHTPMVISPKTIARLLDFEDIFPFYFVGSNADLPIVGGSILSHDHYQGGRHVFPLMKAPVVRTFAIPEFPQVKDGIVKWPSAVLRLRSTDRDELFDAACKVLSTWREFSDEACGVYAQTDAPHNTLNPILHKEGADYVLDLVLRNNRTTPERPWGLFHPDESLHHIKKENIGLIEIMGLAILPGRLIREMPKVQHILYEAALSGADDERVLEQLHGDEDVAKHAAWALDILHRRKEELAVEAAQSVRGEVDERLAQESGAESAGEQKPQNPLGAVMRQEIAQVFAEVLASTGVFKEDETGRAGWRHFLDALGAVE